MRYLASTIAILTSALTVTVAAQAADFTPEETMYDWSGFYIGGHAGYGEARFDGILDLESGSAELGDLSDIDLDGFAGGAHTGFRWQYNQWVVGVEGDITFTDWSDEGVEERDNDGSDFMDGEVDFLATARLLFGFAWDRWLFQVTGGAAFTQAEYVAYNSDPTTTSGDVDFDNLGGVVGGGIAYAVTDMITVRADGLYYIFKDEHDTDNLTVDSSPGDFAEFEDAFVIRGGIDLNLF